MTYILTLGYVCLISLTMLFVLSGIESELQKVEIKAWTIKPTECRKEQEICSVGIDLKRLTKAIEEGEVKIPSA